MIRTLLTTTAISVLLTAGVIAQDAAPAPAAPAPMDAPAPAAPAPAPTTTEAPAPVESGAMETTNTDEPWDISAGYTAVDSDNLASELIDQPVFSSAGDDAENIGNVSDLVFSKDGQITAVVIGVGGFLGIGEKSVAVDFKSLEFTVAADNTERWVVPTTKDALTAAPDFVWQKDEPAPAGTTAPADTTPPAVPAQ
jgi:hypothetical protein